MKLNELTIVEAGKKLDKGEITALDLTRACLARIAAINGKLNACLTVCREESLAAAAVADARLKAGERGPLLGIPFLVKDNILTKGVRTTAASQMLDNYIAPYDATVIKKLKQAGAILLGKTNLDEFAHGASTEYSFFGPTRNPYDLTRVPGGSSGGSAAAVAAEMCLFALGTDTGGSIRHPAAFCGVVGFKPTYGACSRFGLIAMTSSTDVPGPLTKTAADAQVVFAAMRGDDKMDSTSIKSKIQNPKSKIKNSKTLKGIKVGVAKEYFSDSLDKKVNQLVQEAIDNLKKLGAQIVDIILPHTVYGVGAYYLITPAEISSNLARFDGLRYGFKKDNGDLLKYYSATRGQGFGVETKRRIMLGTYALSAGYYEAYYRQAQQVRSKIIQDFNDAFTQVDLIAVPATPTAAFKLGEKSREPLKMYLEDIFMAPVSLAGLPAVSLPAGLLGGLPIGWQLIGQKSADDLVLATATAYEQVVPVARAKLKV